MWRWPRSQLRSCREDIEEVTTEELAELQSEQQEALAEEDSTEEEEDREESAVRILEDPNDLRHDIERRRKERLQNEDENTFYVDGVSQRDEHGCSFPKLRNPQPYGFQKSSRFLNSPFRKFIRKPHMNHHYAAKPRDNIVHEQFEGNLETSHRPFKPHFTDGRPHFRSNLVQKGLYIQAKYQRLRYAGARGFTTNKIRRGFLRKEQPKNSTLGPGNLNRRCEVESSDYKDHCKGAFVCI
ncbi:BCLAF1 and THRAP3 family member 3 [Varanus komodoensis]|nr:BCLAF1 and THRAP3 family member 3 [Varanus komodoensis]